MYQALGENQDANSSSTRVGFSISTDLRIDINDHPSNSNVEVFISLKPPSFFSVGVSDYFCPKVRRGSESIQVFFA